MPELILRVLFDTNIYGQLAENVDSRQFISLLEKNNILVCGSVIVRKELRNIPKGHVIGKAKLRKLALNAYDAL